MNRKRLALSATIGGVVLLGSYVVLGIGAFVFGGPIFSLALAAGSLFGGVAAALVYNGEIGRGLTDESREVVAGVGFWDFVNPIRRWRIGLELWGQEGTLSSAKAGGIAGAAAGLFGVVPAVIVAWIAITAGFSAAESGVGEAIGIVIGIFLFAMVFGFSLFGGALGGAAIGGLLAHFE